MRFVISNYTSITQTEPYYFNASINLLENHKSVIWDQKTISLYDIFDAFKPDIFICSGKAIPSDVVSYSQENGGPKLVINVTELSQKEIDNIENLLLENGVGIEFLFTNSHQKITNTKTKIVNIPFGADIFLNTKKQVNYKIDRCYIVSNEEDIKEEEGIYHYITNNESLAKKADAVLPAISMASIYNNYDEIIIKNNLQILPQVFFDAAYYGNSVRLLSSDNQKQYQVDALLKKLLRLDDGEDLQEKIRVKHTCLNRTKTLLSQFPDQDNINKFDELIEKYRKAKTK